MTRQLSLRARLSLIILAPLMVSVVAIAIWAARDAQIRAADRFDRSLLVTALGISRDTAFSGGNALSEETRDLLRDTSGGPAFYHIYAPDGVFVTGYATPPVPPPDAPSASQYIYYDAVYQGRRVRAVRFADQMTIDNLSGNFTFTVWQNLAVRDGFVSSLSRRTYVVMSTLVVAVALIVWFGVRLGLGPLLDLEHAIARRSSNDLSPIQRPIPEEVRGIVGRLNALLAELATTMRAKDDFISDAAHQLRNPVTGVLALSEAVAAASTQAQMQERSRDLVDAARHTAKLTEDLLAFERAKSTRSPDDLQPVDVAAVLVALVSRLAQPARERGVSVTAETGNTPVFARIDRVLLEQAITNLVVNALDHGGPCLSSISVHLHEAHDVLRLVVEDDGKGLACEDFGQALSRFGQVSPSSGSGLGLPIAKAITEGAGGTLTLSSAQGGLRVEITLPKSSSPAKHRHQR